MIPKIAIRSAGIDDIKIIRNLALQIWPEAYKEILSAEQLDYMLNLFYSEFSLQQQMESGHHFIIITTDDVPMGFAAYQRLDEKEVVFKLHKIYVLTGSHGKGLGKALLKYVKEAVRAAGASKLRLDVNRYNKAKAFYEKLGFVVTGEKDTAIGEGYLMNDYVMELAW